MLFNQDPRAHVAKSPVVEIHEGVAAARGIYICCPSLYNARCADDNFNYRRIQFRRRVRYMRGLKGKIIYIGPRVDLLLQREGGRLNYTWHRTISVV